jgi:hypothetical protein
MFVTSPDVLRAIGNSTRLNKQVDYFKEIGKHLQTFRRITNFDLEMIGN